MNQFIKIAVCFIVLLNLCGCGGSTPEEAFKGITDSAKKGKWGEVYDSLSGKSQGQMDVSLRMMATMAVAFSKDKEAKKKRLEEMSSRDIFIQVFTKKQEKRHGPMSFGELISSEVSGDSATLLIQKNGKEEEFHMVKENGQWKWSTEDAF